MGRGISISVMPAPITGLIVNSRDVRHCVRHCHTIEPTTAAPIHQKAMLTGFYLTKIVVRDLSWMRKLSLLERESIDWSQLADVNIHLVEELAPGTRVAKWSNLLTSPPRTRQLKASDRTKNSIVH